MPHIEDRPIPLNEAFKILYNCEDCGNEVKNLTRSSLAYHLGSIIGVNTMKKFIDGKKCHSCFLLANPNLEKEPIENHDKYNKLMKKLRIEKVQEKAKKESL